MHGSKKMLKCHSGPGKPDMVLGKMEEELRVFDSSMSAWETEIALAILDELDEKVAELRSKFLSAMRRTHPEIQDTVIDQCVQVANLAHMIKTICQHPIFSRCRKGKSVG